MEQEFSLLNYYTPTEEPSDIIISYKGPVSDLVIYEIGQDIRAKFNDSSRISKKIFAIFIELAQNISFYSEERIRYGKKDDRVGTIVISELPDAYRFACGNLVKKEHVRELITQCNVINKLDREGLRDYKRIMRSRPQTTVSQGAGFGLIQVALVTGGTLHLNEHEVDKNYSFFSLSVQIGKE